MRCVCGKVPAACKCPNKRRGFAANPIYLGKRDSLNVTKGSFDRCGDRKLGSDISDTDNLAVKREKRKLEGNGER